MALADIAMGKQTPQVGQAPNQLAQMAQGGQISPAEKRQDKESVMMAQQLAQQPTPEMASQFIDYLLSLRNPHAAQVAQHIDQVKNSPEQLQQLLSALIPTLQNA